MLVSEHQFKLFVDLFVSFLGSFYVVPGLSLLSLIRFISWLFVAYSVFSFFRRYNDS